MHGPAALSAAADPEHSHQEVLWRSAASSNGSGGAAPPSSSPLARLGSLPRSDPPRARTRSGGGGAGGSSRGPAAAATMARALRGALRRAAAGILGPQRQQQKQREQRADQSQEDEASGAARRQRQSQRRREELLSGAAFCAASLAMTLLNKAALSPSSSSSSSTPDQQQSHTLPLPVVSLLAFQCLCTLLLTYAACALGLGRAPPRMGARELRLWLPVNALFAAMVATSFLALRHMGVPMLTVLKNLTSLLVIAGDRLVFGKKYGGGVWLCLGLMTLSALCAAASDLEFSARGYAWQLANNVATAAYSLALRLAILRTARHDDEDEEDGGGEEGKGKDEEEEEGEEEEGGRRRHFSSSSPSPGDGRRLVKPSRAQKRPDDVGMVIYNNLGALPLLLALAVASGEPARLLSAPPSELRALLSDRRFVAAALCSSATGFLLSVASMWFMRCTTATTFSLVGSLNKVPLAVLGALLFAPPEGRAPAWTSPWHAASVAVGLLAGAVFARAKSREDHGGIGDGRRRGGGSSRGGGGWSGAGGSCAGGGGSAGGGGGGGARAPAVQT